MRVAVLLLAIGADFLNGSDGDQEKEIQRVKDYVDIAALLGAPRMRHDITAGYKGENYRSYESLIPTLAQAVREVADYAASKGVMTMTENHGFFSQDSDRVEKLYMAVDHPNFGLLCDLGNFLCADENPAEAVARIAPYTRYVHGKDFIVKPFYSEDPGEGVPLPGRELPAGHHYRPRQRAGEALPPPAESRRV